jgi:hypothetical protein
MSVVSRNLGVVLLYPNRRVYTAPEQQNYSGLPYLNPNNLNEKIFEQEVPSDYSLPDVKPGQNVYDPTRRPSDNLTIHRVGVPLQCDTYNMLDSRYGSSEFNAPIPEVHPKLRTKRVIEYVDYMKGLTKEQISFTREYAGSASYPAGPEFMAHLIRDHRAPVVIKNSVINEPTGMVYKETFNGSKAHRPMNSVGLAPEMAAQEELRHFARTGRWF